MPDNNSSQSLWDIVTGWVQQNAKSYVYVQIPKQQTDAAYDDTPLVPYKSYFRLWLAEMFLTNSVAWGQQWFPAVHCQVQLSFSGETVSFTTVVQPPQDELGNAVNIDTHLVDLMPYNGGLVAIQTSLLGLKGADYLSTAIGIVDQFSSLIGVPLENYLKVAEQVTVGTRDLLSATQGKVQLGYHQEFSSDSGEGNVLKPGYIAVILATATDIDQKQLFVRKDRLLYKHPGDADYKPLTNYDYMLLRIDGKDHRDDWKLKTFADLWDKARGAYVQGDTKGGDGLKAAALAAVWTSPDLTDDDKRMAIKEIKTDLVSFQDDTAGIAHEAVPTPGKPPSIASTESASFAVGIEPLSPLAHSEGQVPRLTSDEVFS